MSLAWTLARRELRGRFRGLRLLLACLVLGVGALAAIGSLTQAISSQLAERGQELLGGDIEFGIAQRRAEPDERQALARLGTVSETIRMQSMAVRPGTADTVPVQLKAVDALYPLYGRLTVTGGKAVPRLPADAVLVAPALADRMRVRVGDRLRFGEADFRVTGVIENEPDRLSEGFSLGAVALMSDAGLSRTGLIQPGSLFETKYRVKLASGSPRAAEQAFKAQFAERGWEIRTRERAAPGASRLVARMGQFLALVGLAALAIAGIGVGNGVESYLAGRRRVIATLKVLGATSPLIARIYLLQVGAVSAVGIVIGLLVGIAAVPLLVALAGQVLPVAPGFALYPQALALAAAYGLLIALGFSAAPLLAARETPSATLLRGQAGRARVSRWRVALWTGGALGTLVALAVLTSDEPLFSLSFLASVAGALLLLALLGWLVRWGARRVPKPRQPLLRLALTGLYRPGARTVALVVALGLGLTLFVLLAAIRTSLDANIARTVPARAPALFALDVPRERAAEFVQTVRSVEPRATVQLVPLLRGSITAYGTTNVAELAQLPEGAWVLRGDRGLTYAANLPAGSTLTAGRWWGAGYRGPPLVSVDAEQGAALGLKLGDPLTVSVLGVEKTARVASFRRVDWSTMGFNFVLVFSPGSFDDLPHNLSATIDLPGPIEQQVTRVLLPRFPSTSVVEVRGVLDQVRQTVDQMATAIAAAASVAVLAGIAVLVGAIAAAREARTYDSVMLKVLGASRRQILMMQLIEFLLLAAVVGALALALGLGAGWYVIVRVFEFEWLPDYRVVALTLGAGTFLTLAIGLLNSLPVLRARPAAALRQVLT